MYTIHLKFLKRIYVSNGTAGRQMQCAWIFFCLEDRLRPMHENVGDTSLDSEDGRAAKEKSQ